MLEATCPLSKTESPQSGYMAHRRRGEDSCRQCKDLYAAYVRERRRTNGRTYKSFQIVCEFCGVQAEVAVRSAKCCSSKCASRMRNGWSTSTEVVPWTPPIRLPVKRLAVRAPVVKPWWRVIVEGPCSGCGERFTTLGTYNNPANIARFCSRECAKHSRRSARRARKAGAFVAPVFRRKVFERDGWRCQICCKKVNRNAEVPHPNAPVLDHIVPLAAGGTHEPSNVQCAHFLCNSLKSDGAANDQLRLIG